MVVSSPWTSLVASCWVEATAGITYVFSSFSDVLKTNLAYDQRHVNRLSVAKDLGDTLGLLAGFLCTLCPVWAMLFLGSLLIFLGYGSIWLLVTQRISSLPFWLVCLLIFMGTNGCTFLDTTALVVSIHNFQNNRGTVVGLLKGFKGLSGAIFVQIFASFLASDQSSFILLLAVGPAIVFLPTVCLIRKTSDKSSRITDMEDVVFKLLYGISLLLAVYMLFVTLLQDFSSVSNKVNVIFTIVLFLLLISMFLSPIIGSRISERTSNQLRIPLLKNVSSEYTSREQQKENLSNVQDCATSTSSVITPDTDFKIESLHSIVVVTENVKMQESGTDLTLRKAFSNFNFWLLFFSIFFSMGSGVTAINNLGQIVDAQGYENTKAFVSMTNIWNFTGRLAAGYVSEKLARVYAHPRTVTLAGVQCFMAVGHILLATAWPGTIYGAIFLVGATYGAHWAIFPTSLSEIFGLQNFSVLYNFVSLASPAGSFIYSGYIAGTIYDWEARKQSNESSDLSSLVCKGAVCFEVTFFIMAGVCLIGAILSVVITMRTRIIYSHLYRQQ